VFGAAQAGWTSCDVYLRDELPPQAALEGPVLIEEPTSTTLVLEGQQVYRDRRGLLIIEEEDNS
jgi:N-methylhydantoinase A